MTQSLALIHVLWLFALAVFWGRSILKRAGMVFETVIEETAFGFSLGFGLLGMGLFALGLAGALTARACYIVFFILTLPMFFTLPKLRGSTAFSWGRALFEKPLLVCLGIVFVLGLVQCMIPSTAHDALAYQLDIPKRFAMAGRVCFIPYGVNSVFPLLMNMFYALSVLWDGTRMANLCHLLTAGGIVLGILALEKKYLPKAWLGAGALVFVLTPGVFNQMTIAYNDIALSFFNFFAFFSVLKWQEQLRLRWLGLAGVYLGFALGVKYLAGLAAVAIVLLLMAQVLARRAGMKNVLTGLILMGGVAFLIGFAWYFRSFLHEGSWLYFGEKGYAAKGVKDLFPLLTPWFMTMDPERFGGSWARLGPIYLAFVPGVFLIRQRSRELNAVLFLSITYFLLWFLLPRQNLRFLFPVCALWAFLIGFLVARGISGNGLRKMIRGLFFAVLAFEFISAAHHGRDGYKAALGLETDQAYLERVERSYPAARFVNTGLRADAKILNAYEVRMFYFDRDLVREPEFGQKTHYDTRFPTVKETIAYLKQQGFTHVLLAGADLENGEYPPRNVRTIARDPDLARQFFRERYQGASPADPKFQYRLLELV